MVFITHYGEAELTDGGKDIKVEQALSWHEIKAHLALRGDFFITRVGFGIGFNVAYRLLTGEEAHLLTKVYVDGNLSREEDKSAKIENDDFNSGYLLVLMPMIYVAL